MTFAFSELLGHLSSIKTGPEFNPGIKTDVLLTGMKINDKLDNVLSVLFRSKKNGALNTTNIFGPSRTYAQTDDAFSKQAMYKVQQICEILACVWTKPNGSYSEAMEDVVDQFKDCDKWADVINQAIKAYNKGVAQHQKLYKNDEVNVSGIWVYNNNDYVVLRFSAFGINIYPTELIDCEDKTKFFKVNERYDRFTKQEQVEDDLSKVDGLLGRKVTVDHEEEEAGLPF
jgi:hypothetical protein